MPLRVLDGNQTATTLSSVVTGGEHIVAHTVVSLGSTAISNITSAVSGSVVSISNFPSTQTIAGTVTVGASSVTFNSNVAKRPDGSWQPLSVESGSNYVNARVYPNDTTPFLATVTVGNSITISSLPAISGTVTANVPAQKYFSLSAVTANRSIIGFSSSGGNQFTEWGGSVEAEVVISGSKWSNANPAPVLARLQDGSGNNLTSTTIGGSARLNVTLASATTTGVALPAVVNVYAGSDSGTVRAVAVDSSGRSVVTVSNFPATQPVSIASVTIGNSITIGSFATSVTARLVDPTGTAVSYASTGTAGNPSSDVISIQGVSGGTSVPVSISSVTIGAVPNGALITRFGSVTTANTAQISSAVTNASRKYLLVQNVTTSSNVITIGIGFTPTTTQGIQLSAGGGITFESSYIPTGAVYILSSVTASPFTILEA